MRFFWTGNLTSPKPIKVAIILFSIFVFFFIVGNFVHFGLKYGYSIEKVENYFFGSDDFPVEISLTQVLEEAHVNLFVFSLLFLCVSALIVYSNLGESVKFIFVLTLALSSFMYTISDFLVIEIGRGSGFLKIFLFFLFQLTLLAGIILGLFRGLNGKRTNGTSKNLALIIFIFAILNFVFAVFNFILFEQKIGLKISDISNYYLGNPEKFIKPKSLIGTLEISYFHFLPMAVYLLTLSHFVFLVNGKFNIALTILLFLTALVDNVSGVFIVIFGDGFVIVKFVSFLLFEFFLLFSSVVLICKFFKTKFNFPNRGHI